MNNLVSDIGFGLFLLGILFLYAAQMTSLIRRKKSWWQRPLPFVEYTLMETLIFLSGLLIMSIGIAIM